MKYIVLRAEDLLFIGFPSAHAYRGRCLLEADFCFLVSNTSGVRPKVPPPLSTVPLA